MLTHLQFIPVKSLLLLIAAVAFTILSHDYDDLHTNNYNNQEHLHPDAISSIERATTKTCKSELLEVASRSNDDGIHRRLLRTCHHDVKSANHKRLGCLRYPNWTDPIILQQPKKELDLGLCLNLCFSYGHRFGGFNETGKKCICDDLEHTITEASCSNADDGLLWFQVDDGIYKPTRSRAQFAITNKPEHSQIRIVFLLSLNGRSVLQVRRLMKLIYRTEHYYYIHIDGRMRHLQREMSTLAGQYGNIFIAQERYNTVWGGPSLLTMMLDSMKFTQNLIWDYMINLSESDLPIKPITELELFLSENFGTVFLRGHNMQGYKFIRKQGLDRTFYQCDNRVWRIADRILPMGIIYSGGSDWFALPHDFCNYILDNSYHSNQEKNLDSKLVQTLINTFNQTLLPAETFFHTVAINSKFCDRIQDDNLRLINWRRKQGCNCQHKNIVDWCGCSPLVFKLNDWAKLIRTKHTANLFFARKFDPTIDASIINRVESELLSSEHTGNDTRYWLKAYGGDDEDNSISGDQKMYEDFGRLVLRSLNISWAVTLRDVSFFFEDNKFLGYILLYCSRRACLEFLVERKPSGGLVRYDHECFGTGEEKLQALQVDHGFDTNEKLFRNFSPLNHNSDIVIFHEWLVERSGKTKKYSPSKIFFKFYNIERNITLNQAVKLKITNNSTRLSLVHNLTNGQPMRTGTWHFSLENKGRSCLLYEFLVFGGFDIRVETFQRHYHVSNVCHNNTLLTGLQSDCAGWSSEAKQARLDAYKL